MVNSVHGQDHLIPLVHHVQLNKLGWWRRAVQELIVACAFTLGPSSERDIRDQITELCGASPNAALITAAIQQLMNDKQLLLFNDKYHLSEDLRNTIAQRRKEILDSELELLHVFKAQAQRSGLADHAEQLWVELETKVVSPMAQHLGARLYHILAILPQSATTSFEQHVAEYMSDQPPEIRSFIIRFLDPRDTAIRQFVLRRLNARYAVDAAGLPQDTLDRLMRDSQRVASVNLFLDTNVVLSMLDLRDHHENETVKELQRLFASLPSHMAVHLYILPATVYETTQVLTSELSQLEHFRGQPNLARAAVPHSSGILRRYFEKAAASANWLLPEEYFRPYLSGLHLILRQQGISVFDFDLSDLHTHPEVIEDINYLADIQDQYRPGGAKRYPANRHDAVLWHFTRSKRTNVDDLPLEVNNWLVTLDYGLIRFDQHKRAQSLQDVPVCLEPSSLIQLLQFWVPSSVELNEALVGSVREPLLLLKFDEPSQEVSIRMLNLLSVYEDAIGFPTDLVAQILANDALRERLTELKNDPIREEQLIRDAMMQEYNEQVVAKQTEIERAREAAAAAEGQIAQERADRMKMEDKLVEQSRNLEEKDAEIERLWQEVHQIKQERRDRAAYRRQNYRMGVALALTVILSIVPLYAGALLTQWLSTFGRWFVSVGIAWLVLMSGLELAARGTRFENTRAIEQVSKLNRRWVAYLGILALSVIADLSVL